MSEFSKLVPPPASKKSNRINKFSFRKPKQVRKSESNRPSDLCDIAKGYSAPDFSILERSNCCNRAKHDGNHLMMHFRQANGAPHYTDAYNFVVQLREQVICKTPQELNTFITREYERCMVSDGTSEKNHMNWEIDGIPLCR